MDAEKEPLQCSLFILSIHYVLYSGLKENTYLLYSILFYSILLFLFYSRIRPQPETLCRKVTEEGITRESRNWPHHIILWVPLVYHLACLLFMLNVSTLRQLYYLTACMDIGLCSLFPTLLWVRASYGLWSEYFVIYLSRVLCLCVCVCMCVCVTICCGTLSYSFSFGNQTDQGDETEGLEREG